MKNDRLANVVLYLLKGRPDAGLTVLLKLVYLSDYEHYQKHLSTITGASYVVQDRGPVLQHYRDYLDAMQTAGFFKIKKIPIPGKKPKEEYELLGEPDLTAFTKDERETLDHVLMVCDGMTGADLSDQSHAEMGPWKLAGGTGALGGVIPPALFRWFENFADEKDVEEAKRRAKSPEIAAAIAEALKAD